LIETCEVCGKATDELYLTKIEEATMWLCVSCSRGKQVMQSVNARKDSPRQIAVKKGKEVEEIVENYGEQIRKAREAMGLPTRVLAERISEKESELVRVEKQKTLPSENLRKKIEKELGIKLTAKVEAIEGGKMPTKGGPITLGDAAFSKEQINKEEEEAEEEEE